MSRPPCHVAPLLRGYVDDELSATETTLVEEHVGRCEGCSARLQREAQMCEEMFALADVLQVEIGTPATPSRRRWRWPRLAWPSVFVSAALMFAVCDQAAMSEALDAATVAPGATRVMARGGVDETRPACEESTWLGPESLADGPTCAETRTVAVALASFPPDPDPLGWDDDPMCHPDDGGDLACMPDEPV